MNYETALAIQRYVNERYGQVKRGKEGVLFRWAINRAVEHFMDCLRHGEEIPDAPPLGLRFEDEATKAGYMVAYRLWMKQMA